MALIGKLPNSTLAGETSKRNGDLGISINETMVEVRETEEGLNVLDFLLFGPILNDLNFVRSHRKSFGRQHISEVFAGSDMELAFVCMGEKAISSKLFQYFLDMFLVFENVIRIY